MFYNTVVAAKNGIVLLRREGDPEYAQRVAGNAVFGRPALAVPAAVLSANVAEPYDAAASYLNEPVESWEKLDLYPLPGRLRLPQKVLTEEDAMRRIED